MLSACGILIQQQGKKKNPLSAFCYRVVMLAKGFYVGTALQGISATNN